MIVEHTMVELIKIIFEQKIMIIYHLMVKKKIFLKSNERVDMSEISEKKIVLKNMTSTAILKK